MIAIITTIVKDSPAHVFNLTKIGVDLQADVYGYNQDQAGCKVHSEKSKLQ